MDGTQRETARQKLAQILRFAEIQSCRRKFLLEYFGEQWDQANCGGCDVCLTPKEKFDATEISQKILSGVIRTGQRFGANHVIDVLRGADTKRVGALGHDKLTVYGIVLNFSADELKQLVRSLTERDVLAVNGTDRPTISVTPAGMSFLKGRETLRLTKPSLTKPNGSNGHGPRDQDLAQACDQELFEKLRALRKRIADERGVPPYVIFRDTVLREMATLLPRDRESFAGISGVGSAKSEQFSGPFLEVIAEHVANIRSWPEEAGNGRKDPRKPRKLKGPTLEETKALLQQGLSIADVSERRGLARSTITGHLERLIMEGEPIDIDYLLPPPERVAKIRSAFLRADSASLAPVRELLGEEFSYDEIRLARLGLRQRGLIG